jgi:hypothetical protein
MAKLCSKLVQISDVTGHSQRHTSAATLPRLDRAERPRETLCYRSHVSDGGRATMQHEHNLFYHDV